MNPLVSVIIPTYKRESLLTRALHSVATQTYQNLEVIIIDDSPTQKPKSFFGEFDDLNIIYIHNEKKQGAPHARNIGISESKGEFIAFLDDDDTWQSTKIEKQVNEMLSHLWCPLCITYSHDLRFNHDRINKPPRIITHKDLIKSFNLSSTSSYLVRKYALDITRKIDGYYFDETLKSGQEYDLAIRITKNEHDVITVEEPLITQYSGDSQISENWSNKISGIMRLYTKYHHEYALIDHIKTVGLLGLFSFGYIFGNRIYSIIIPIKEVYENV